MNFLTWRRIQIITLKAATIVPAVVLVVIAGLIHTNDYQNSRMTRLEQEAHLSAAAVDLRLSKMQDLTEFCSSSPALILQLDLDAIREDCGRYAAIIDSWIVLVEVGEIHRQLINTSHAVSEALPNLPSSEEHPAVMDVLARSRSLGSIQFSRVFRGPVAGTNVVTTAKFLRLPDGREAVLSVATDVNVLSNVFTQASSREDTVFLLVDPSHQIVAASGGHHDDNSIIAAPSWMERHLNELASGAELGRIGTEGLEGRWDFGFVPLAITTGWMVVAASPSQQALFSSDLTTVPLLLVILGFLFSGGAFWLLSYRHSTQLKLAAVEKSNSEKSTLLASLAHEIRSPILSLMSFLENEAETTRPNVKKGALASVEAVLQVIDDVLELSLLRSGNFTLSPSPVDITRLVEDLTARLRQVAANKGLSLDLIIAGRMPPLVEVDRLRLEQVLSNLLSNAIKYTDEGSIVLQVLLDGQTQQDSKITFKVKDTGIGIPPENMSQVFLDFGRLERKSAELQPGFGLGLPIVNRILKEMKSELVAESLPTRGSTFSFSLLLPNLLNKSTTGFEENLRNVTILYAEDEPIIRRMTTKRLTDIGAEVIEVTNGSEVIAKLKTRVPNLILLDLQMPSLDGVATLRQIQQMDPPPGCPVFVLTSHISGPRAMEAKKAGADEVFTKPVQVAAIAAALRRQHGAWESQVHSLGPQLHWREEVLIETTKFHSIAGRSPKDKKDSFLPLIVESIQKETNKIYDALTDGCLREALQLAHRTHSLCQAAGARRLAVFLALLEDTIRQGDDRSARLLATQLKSTVSATLDEMNRLGKESIIT